MGYRSEVVYAAAFDDADDRKRAIGLAKLVHSRADITRADIWGNLTLLGDNLIVFYDDSVKWYDGYEGVVFCDELFGFFNDKCGATVKTLRLGEEPNDIEEHYFEPPEGYPDRYEDLEDLYPVVSVFNSVWWGSGTPIEESEDE